MVCKSLINYVKNKTHFNKNEKRNTGVIDIYIIVVWWCHLSGQTFLGNAILCDLQYTPRNMHTVFALLCFVVVIHWLIFPYPSGLLHWHCGNLTIAQVPAKQPWWIWINTSCEFIMNDSITTTKQSTTKPCAYFLGYTLFICKPSYKPLIKMWVYWDGTVRGNPNRVLN